MKIEMSMGSEMDGCRTQEKHDYDYGDEPIIHINKHDLTLKKGQSETLKAFLLPGEKSVLVKWWSSNPKIAKVSNSGKVTAVAPGTAVISIYSEKYNFTIEETGISDQCYVTVPGESKDAKPLGASDLTYSYGKTALKIPTSKYSDALANVKKSIGGNDYNDKDYNRTGLIFGSKEFNKAHTYIYCYNFGYGFEAREKSPIKTSRGIAIGTKKSTVQQKYGLPSEMDLYMEEGKACEHFGYRTKVVGKGLYMIMEFYIANGKVTKITFIREDIFYNFNQ